MLDYNVIFRYGGTTTTFGSFAGSPITLVGFVNGTEYSVTVRARNAIGLGPESAPFVLTPKAAQTITFANPGAQNLAPRRR